MKIVKFITKIVMIVGIGIYMQSNVIQAQIPLRENLEQTKEAPINLAEKHKLITADLNGEKKLPTNNDNVIVDKNFKSAILSWPEIPNAVMYELIVKDMDTQAVVFTKYNIYASGYQLDSDEVDLTKNLKWQVRGLNKNKVPISDYTKPRILHKGTIYNSNWQQQGDKYNMEAFSQRDYNTRLITDEVKVNPIKITTNFAKMDFMPVYPVYSWVPVKNTEHYKIDVFYVPKYDFNNIKRIASYTSPQNMDYYDTKAYTDRGLYYFNIQAYDNNNKKIAESKNTYFTVKTENIKVAALGDSITHGGGAISTPPSATLYNWETYADLPILNIGFSGNLTSDMLKRFDNDVLAFKPKILVIMGGVNDIRTGISADVVISNLTKIKDKCFTNNITPVFLTVTSVNPPKMKAVAKLDISQGWNEERKKINDWVMKQSYHVDVSSGLIDERGFLADNMTTDGLHPDYEGKKHIGELVGNYLKNNFISIIN